MNDETDDPIDLGIEDLSDAVEVGAGGFGTVYKARQVSLRRDVAVKMVANTVKDRKVRIRFEREIQAMGMLSGHPNIVTVYDSGFTSNGQPYILMDYMEQGSLGDRLDRDGTVPYPDTLDIMVKVCGALETAHQAGILHRDLKPENVLVSAYGEPKLGDFGIARLKGGPETGTSSLTASIEHVSPELLEAKAPAIASDLYAMGSTMFKMLTGQAAFIRPGDESIVPALTRIRDEPVPNLRERGVPDPVCRVIERAMAKDPDSRFASSADMGQALRDAQQLVGLLPTPLPIREEEAAAARDATRTIHSDDIARSMEVIRRSGGHPAPFAPGTGPVAPGQPGAGRMPSGPVSPSAPAPPGPGRAGPPTGGYAPPPPAPAPGYASGPQSPQSGYRPTGPAPVAAQGFTGPPPGGQPGFQQPQPAKSATPWGKIIGGSVVGAVLLVLLIAFLGSGTDDEPDPDPEPTLVQGTTTAAPVPTPTEVPSTEPTVEPTLPDYVYTTLHDDTETLAVDAPQTWTDLELGPWVNDGSEIGRQIVASPDVAGFRSSWNHPGLIFSVSEQLAGAFDPSSLLDQFSFATQCQYEGRSPYSDALYTGMQDNYSACGGTETSYRVVAAWPTTEQDVLLLVQYQAVTERDDDAFERVLRTFQILSPDGTQ